ncbi:MAG TPA: hypothetical protein VK306_01635 [Acidimicrobiales bacterium]|nr:hypothetical protein [Acidimicrobiales bacterium]
MTGTGAPWPVAGLDRIARLRALAAGLPGSVLREQVLDAPFDDVWGFVGDIERSVPAFDRNVARLAIDDRDGDRLRGRAWAPHVPVPFRYDMVLRPGWCWMTTRPTLHVVGMAAEPDGERTRYAHLEALVVAGPPPVRALARPLLAAGRRLLARHVADDVAGVVRHTGGRAPWGAG